MLYYSTYCCWRYLQLVYMRACVNILSIEDLLVSSTKTQSSLFSFLHYWNRKKGAFPGQENISKHWKEESLADRSIWTKDTSIHDQAYNIWLFIQYDMTYDLSLSPQATCFTNLASLSQTGTASSKVSTQSVAPPGDASSVARVWLSKASPNARLAVHPEVKYWLLSGGCKASICLCC